MNPVVDETSDERFVYADEGWEAELVYHVHDDRLTLVHTEVPEAMEGRGIGGLLVQAAVDKARHAQLTIVPHCPFARSWLEEHQDATEGVTIDW